MNRSQKTKQWLKKHNNDPFVKLARQQGYRSRAAYKLKELLPWVPKQKNINILELGAAPGGWTQVLVEQYPEARIVAIDLLAMDNVSGALFLKGDMRDATLWDAIPHNMKPFHGILSDMMPNTSGDAVVDQYALCDLLEHMEEIIHRELLPGGWVIIKYFEGHGIAQWRARLKKHFTKIMMKKPEASRSASKEQYLIGLGYAPH